MFRKSGYGPQRLFQKGGFKYLILDLLKEKPHYGYEIIRALEERFHGFYTPSPGIVYPTLQMLEEMGYVTGSEQDAKRVYSITEAGLSFLTERQKAAEDAKRQMEKWQSPEIHDKFHEIKHELWEVSKLIVHKARGIDAEKLREVQEVISHAYKDIETILGRNG
jgi:DNA-binding PadR family transcriptional regulator